MKLDQFKEIRIDDRGVIKPVLDAANKVSCDYNFANIFMWADIFRLRWALDEGRLLVLSLRDDVTLMPVGPGVTPGYLCALANAFGREGKSGGFVLADALFVEGNPRITECFEPSIDGDNADYVYATRALVELKGRRLHKKKNLLSQFLRNNPDYRCEPIARGHFADCFTLAEKWCEDRNCESLGFTHETSALRRGFDQFEALNLEGLVVSSRGAMVAFSIFSRQNTVTADIHF
ncbi:MAG: phosphatidylglycerol lysyltransferase domain-containing protein, partial [Candidatus Aureabacteria bacterium]|nr:phosphatidylglycerol lysyltransferase domain-containing protein [Candidatus Auribacterota bacterium]